MEPFVYAVFRNTDLTEGRGASKPVALFDNLAAAQEAALGINVQGTNGSVEQVPIYSSFEDYFEQADDWEKGRHRDRLRNQISRLTDLLSKAG